MPAKDRREAKAEREASKTVEKSAKQKQQEEVRGPTRRCEAAASQAPCVDARCAAPTPRGAGGLRLRARYARRAALRHALRSLRVCALQQGGKQRRKNPTACVAARAASAAARLR